MIIIDSHLDLAWNALNWNRDLTQPISEIRRVEAPMKEAHRGGNTVSFPEMRKGEVAICLATLLARSSGLGEANLDFRTREAASAMARGQLAYYGIMERQGWMRMLKTWQDVEAHLHEWQKPGGHSAPLGFILSMEGADPILSPADVAEWWNDGLRVVGLAHYGVSAYAHGTGVSGGLTSQGFDLLRAMSEVGMVLDVTHLADESFWRALEMFRGPVLASHNNCRSLVPGERQFSDEQVRYLLGRGSVIGVAFDSWMLYPGYDPGKTPNSLVSLEAVADQIDHICQLAGDARHAAIGSDLDGGFGREQSPHDLNTIADLQKIPAILRNRGYTETDIEAVMRGNWLRYFRRAWEGPQRP
ncbi:MAG: dipeptidase [Terriglobia bacterium]